MNTPDGTLPENTEAAEIESNETTGLVEAEVTESTGSAETLEGSEIPENVGNEESGEDAEAPESAATVVAEVDDTKIGEAVRFINEKAAETIYKGSIEIGEYVLEHFFNNDIELASSKDPTKNVSYKKLRDREDLMVSPMQLSTMVRVASQERFLSEKGVNTDPLKYTHKALLTKLTNDEQKIGLIDECVQGGWTTSELDEKVKDIYNQLVPGQKPSLIRKTASYIAAIKKISKLPEPPAMDVGQADISELKEKQRENLGKKLGKLKESAEASSRKTEAILNYCDTLLGKLSDDRGNGQQSSEESTNSPEQSEE